MNGSLYVKTNYSLLSSLVSIDSLIEFALNKNLKTLAICDDNLTSTKEFYNKCINNIFVEEIPRYAYFVLPKLDQF